MMEKLDRRFGTVAIESGFITVGQLVGAMKIQIQDELKGAKHRLIGEILLDEGYITDIQIEEVLKTMRL
jgi:hypothetical protein